MINYNLKGFLKMRGQLSYLNADVLFCRVSDATESFISQAKSNANSIFESAIDTIINTGRQDEVVIMDFTEVEVTLSDVEAYKPYNISFKRKDFNIVPYFDAESDQGACMINNVKLNFGGCFIIVSVDYHINQTHFDTFFSLKSFKSTKCVDNAGKLVNKTIDDYDKRMIFIHILSAIIDKNRRSGVV